MIFDVDGTLVDSNDAHAAAFVEAFAQFGLQVGFEEVRRLIGEGSDKLIPRLIGRYDEALAERKKKIDALLEKARARAYFDELTDADDVERSKPDPDIVLAALDKLRLAAGRCVMVGDTPYDAAAARRAGVGFVGVRCGGWLDADLQPAIGVYDDPADLLASLVKDPGCARRTPS